MDYQPLFIITSIWTIGSLFIAIYLLIPKAFKEWQAWKKTTKSIHLSSAILLSFLATGILLGMLLRFVKLLAGG